jgi:arylsulfatase A-like enzyme/Flp pilus assembly protein TadD
MPRRRVVASWPFSLTSLSSAAEIVGQADDRTQRRVDLRARRVAAGLGVMLAACAGPREPGQRVGERGPRDVVLVTVDTLRYDATGFSGAGRVQTPTMDALAEGGAVYVDAHAHSVTTLPSHASILTGRLPYEHGVRDNAGFVLGQDLPTLATVLSQAGWATGAFVSAFPLDRRFGLDRGFDDYDDDYRGGTARPFTIAERTDAETVARARAWWNARAGRRRFLWVHLFGPHYPYEPGEPFASRHAGEPYYGEVAGTDHALAGLLDPLREGDEAAVLVVLTADHGESLGEHGERGHGLFAYEATLHVPLVVWGPGLVQPGTSPRPVGHVDIVPTVLDLLGVPPPDGLAGRSLAGPAGEVERGLYFEALSSSLNRGWAPLHGRIEQRMKAIRLPVGELYDLRQDPSEVTNLAPSRPAELEQVLGRLPAAAFEPSRRDALDPDVVARLRALGYVAASAGSTSPEAALDPALDPKRLVGVQNRIDDATSAYRRGEVEPALRILEGLAADHPGIAVIHSHLGYLLLDAGRPEEAARRLAVVVERGGGDASLRVLLAWALLRGGAPERAREALAPLAETPDPEVQRLLGLVATRLGQAAHARERFERALRADPSYPEAELELGLLDVREGRLAEAEPRLRRALEQDPRLALGWNALGVVLAQRGDLEGALAAWSEASAAAPELPDPVINRSRALAGLGRTAEAIAELEGYVERADAERGARARALLAALRGGSRG